MYFNANADFESAKKEADLNEPETMCRLFATACTKFYLDNTSKTYEELKQDGFYSDIPNWSANITGKEWKSVEDCIECAEEAINQLLFEEELI